MSIAVAKRGSPLEHGTVDASALDRFTGGEVVLWGQDAAHPQARPRLGSHSKRVAQSIKKSAPGGPLWMPALTQATARSKDLEEAREEALQVSKDLAQRSFALTLLYSLYLAWAKPVGWLPYSTAAIGAVGALALLMVHTKTKRMPR